MESTTSSGELVGFDIDLGNAICAKLKVKCVRVENPFDGMIPALQARKFDAINSSMSQTEKRAKAIGFSHKIYANFEALVVRGGSALVAMPKSLNEKHIGVLQGSTQEAYARKHWTNGVDIVPYPSQDQVWNDLAVGGSMRHWFRGRRLSRDS
ncbi:transporter substrate-binding domain-containing protein [Paraburkholderia sp. UCT31]|uniref:transporter substrate-binding domain-containing protein n=1 Tax=Paraburkholderia sp. UCT31 TaxID=2615209 RepID=UPI003975F193